MSRIEKVLFFIDVEDQDKLDERNIIIDAICNDDDAHEKICSNSERRLLEFTGHSIRSLIESVDLDTLKQLTSSKYHSLYEINIKVKEFDLSYEDVDNIIKDKPYFSRLCKFFDKHHIEYDKNNIIDFYYYLIRDGYKRTREFIYTAIEYLKDYLDNKDCAKFIDYYEIEIRAILCEFFLT